MVWEVLRDFKNFGSSFDNNDDEDGAVRGGFDIIDSGGLGISARSGSY